MNIQTNGINSTFTPPSPTSANRAIPLRSRASSRGELINIDPMTGEAQVFGFESSLEQKVYFLLKYWFPDAKIREQFPIIKYRDHKGRTKTHCFDIFCELPDTTKIAIAVKSSRSVRRSDIQETLKLLRAQVPFHVATEVRLVTEMDFSRIDALNAERTWVAYRFLDDALDELIIEYLISLKTRGRISSIIEAFGNDTNVYWSVLRLLQAGKLACDRQQEIRTSTMVTLGRTN